MSSSTRFDECRWPYQQGLQEPRHQAPPKNFFRTSVLLRRSATALCKSVALVRQRVRPFPLQLSRICHAQHRNIRTIEALHPLHPQVRSRATPLLRRREGFLLKVQPSQLVRGGLPVLPPPRTLQRAHTRLCGSLSAQRLNPRFFGTNKINLICGRAGRRFFFLKKNSNKSSLSYHHGYVVVRSQYARAAEQETITVG